VSGPRIGVLALQGGFAPHVAVLRRLGADAMEVRRVAELDAIAGLVIPGGESTTLLNLMADEPWFDGLRALHARGGRLMATCAGAILLAREVRNPPQPCLGLLDAVVARNAYGRQVDSFEARVRGPAIGEVPAVFIRAPRFERLGDGVTTLARFGGDPVLVQQGGVLAMTFHPELTQDERVHRLFLTSFDGRRVPPRATGPERSAP
jgi:5'-phosphate synthase pdxT subunit